MSEEKISYVMNMTFCSREEAIVLLEKNNNDMFESVCEFFGVTKKEKKLDETQSFFAKLREDLAEHEKKCVNALTSIHLPGSVEQVETKTHHEEKVLQNNYSQVCLPPSPESTD